MDMVTHLVYRNPPNPKGPDCPRLEILLFLDCHWKELLWFVFFSLINSKVLQMLLLPFHFSLCLTTKKPIFCPYHDLQLWTPWRQGFIFCIPLLSIVPSTHLINIYWLNDPLVLSETIYPCSGYTFPPSLTKPVQLCKVQLYSSLESLAPLSYHWSCPAKPQLFLA